MNQKKLSPHEVRYLISQVYTRIGPVAEKFNQGITDEAQRLRIQVEAAVTNDTGSYYILSVWGLQASQPNGIAFGFDVRENETLAEAEQSIQEQVDRIAGMDKFQLKKESK